MFDDGGGDQVHVLSPNHIHLFPIDKGRKEEEEEVMCYKAEEENKKILRFEIFPMT